jgi:hypothetical protein
MKIGISRSFYLIGQVSLIPRSQCQYSMLVQELMQSIPGVDLFSHSQSVDTGRRIDRIRNNLTLTLDYCPHPRRWDGVLPNPLIHYKSSILWTLDAFIMFFPGFPCFHNRIQHLYSLLFWYALLHVFNEHIYRSSTIKSGRVAQLGPNPAHLFWNVRASPAGHLISYCLPSIHCILWIYIKI